MVPRGNVLALMPAGVLQRFFTVDGQSLKPGAETDFTRIVNGLVFTDCNEFDGRMSNALRNFLFDAGEDLAGRNIFRGRELGIPQYNVLADCFGVTPDSEVWPL